MSGPREGRLLLVVGPRSYRVRAHLEAARRLGVEVTVATPHASPAASLAPDRVIAYGAGSHSRALAQIEALAARVPIGAVVGPDDDTALLAARAARRLGLPHDPPAAVAAARDKLRMRERLHAAGVPTPWHAPVGATEAEQRRLAARAPYPCVVKPRRLSAGLGVQRAEGPASFVRACRRAHRAIDAHAPQDGALEGGAVMAEAYLHGAEVALEGLLTGGRLHPLALLDKPDAGDGPFFEETLLVRPSRLDATARAAVLRTVEEAARALGLERSPVHAELRVHAGEARLLELAPRSIGGLCSTTLRLRAGGSLEQLAIRAAFGETIPARDLEPADGASGVMMLPVPRAGRLLAVHGVERARDVEHVRDVVVSAPPGLRLAPAPDSDRYLGFVFAAAPDPAAVETALRRASGRLQVEMRCDEQEPAARAAE